MRGYECLMAYYKLCGIQGIQGVIFSSKNPKFMFRHVPQLATSCPM